VGAQINEEGWDGFVRISMQSLEMPVDEPGELNNEKRLKKEKN
jgi:hypothetical protein